jgi:hypothetical protein
MNASHKKDNRQTRFKKVYKKEGFSEGQQKNGKKKTGSYEPVFSKSPGLKSAFKMKWAPFSFNQKNSSPGDLMEPFAVVEDPNH